MLSRIISAALVTVGVSSRASAGAVSFIPQTPTTVQQGGVVTFDVVISESSLAQFDSVFMVIGSDSRLLLEFQYDLGFCDNSTDGCPPPDSFGVFKSDLGVGGNRFANPAFVAPVLTGVLSVDTSETPLGLHEIFVSTSREMNFFGGASFITLGVDSEPLEGTATITVVPEPTGVMILVIGAAAAAGLRIRRRRENSA